MLCMVIGFVISSWEDWLVWDFWTDRLWTFGWLTMEYYDGLLAIKFDWSQGDAYTIGETLPKI